MNSAATAVTFHGESFFVTLADGRELQIPLSRVSTLTRGGADQRLKVSISPSGKGLHWEELDEDLSVEGLLHARRWGHP